MTAALERPATRRCVRIFDDDYNYLKTVAEDNGLSRDSLIRSILTNHVKHLRERERKAIAEMDIPSDLFAPYIVDLGE